MVKPGVEIMRIAKEIIEGKECNLQSLENFTDLEIRAIIAGIIRFLDINALVAEEKRKSGRAGK